MAARKTGLGKGLDGLFPSYVEKPAPKDKKGNKKEKSASKSNSDKEIATEIEYDDRPKTKTKEKSGNKTVDKEGKSQAGVKKSTKETSAVSEMPEVVEDISEIEDEDFKIEETEEIEDADTFKTSKDTAAQVKSSKKSAGETAKKSSNKSSNKSSIEPSEESSIESSEEPGKEPENDTPDISNESHAEASEKRAKDNSNESTTMVDINKVEPNRNQPRKAFDEDSLNELAESIKLYGIISPIIVADNGDYYEIIAGERRWRAARIAGLKEVPVIVRDFDQQRILEISLIENIQREDLNPIDEAKAYQRLSEEFSLTQDEVSERVSKSRSTITNSLRLLKLDERVQDMVREEKLSSGHARALLAISDPDRQYELAVQIFDEKMSVREVEKLIKALSRQPKEKNTASNTAMDIIYREMEDRMKSVLGTKVSVTRKNDKRGKIEIEYYSTEELERIYELLSSLS